MITKAIIEKVINRYSVKVRIPIYHKIAGAAGSTKSENLPTATICVCSKNAEVDFRAGDIVFVDFEEETKDKPIILGYLYKEDL